MEGKGKRRVKLSILIEREKMSWENEGKYKGKEDRGRCDEGI